eukprot:Platyproteum_vivax@DN12693_c0_g1_i1.p1
MVISLFIIFLKASFFWTQFVKIEMGRFAAPNFVEMKRKRTNLTPKKLALFGALVGTQYADNETRDLLEKVHNKIVGGVSHQTFFRLFKILATNDYETGFYRWRAMCDLKDYFKSVVE